MNLPLILVWNCFLDLYFFLFIWIIDVGIEYGGGFHLVPRADDAVGPNISFDFVAQRNHFFRVGFQIANQCKVIG